MELVEAHGNSSFLEKLGACGWHKENTWRRVAGVCRHVPACGRHKVTGGGQKLAGVARSDRTKSKPFGKGFLGGNLSAWF